MTASMKFLQPIMTLAQAADVTSKHSALQETRALRIILQDKGYEESLHVDREKETIQSYQLYIRTSLQGW